MSDCLGPAILVPSAKKSPLERGRAPDTFLLTHNATVHTPGFGPAAPHLRKAPRAADPPDTLEPGDEAAHLAWGVSGEAAPGAPCRTLHCAKPLRQVGGRQRLHESGGKHRGVFARPLGGEDTSPREFAISCLRSSYISVNRSFQGRGPRSAVASPVSARHVCPPREAASKSCQ